MPVILPSAVCKLSHVNLILYEAGTLISPTF